MPTKAASIDTKRDTHQDDVAHNDSGNDEGCPYHLCWRLDSQVILHWVLAGIEVDEGVEYSSHRDEPMLYQRG